MDLDERYADKRCHTVLSLATLARSLCPREVRSDGRHMNGRLHRVGVPWTLLQLSKKRRPNHGSHAE
jgi:hypothetical protein